MSEPTNLLRLDRRASFLIPTAFGRKELQAPIITNSSAHLFTCVALPWRESMDLTPGFICLFFPTFSCSFLLISFSEPRCLDHALVPPCLLFTPVLPCICSPPFVFAPFVFFLLSTSPATLPISTHAFFQFFLLSFDSNAPNKRRLLCDVCKRRTLNRNNGTISLGASSIFIFCFLLFFCFYFSSSRRLHDHYHVVLSTRTQLESEAFNALHSRAGSHTWGLKASWTIGSARESDGVSVPGPFHHCS
jgi:hypothetical protein